MNATAAKIVLAAAVVLPNCWSQYASANLDYESTSSVQMHRFFAARPPIVTLAFGGLCLLVVHYAFPSLRWWELLLLVGGGACLGHCFWPL